MSEKMNVQCFVKKSFEPLFTGHNSPKLLYVSSTTPDASTHPRVMHAHKDFTELSLILSGESEYLINNHQEKIRKGDLLIYNAGVVHDEISGPNTEIGSYCIAVGGLNMPGLRKDVLIPDDAGVIFPTGEYFDEMRTLFSMMYHSLSVSEPQTEAFCTSLMHAALLRALSLSSGKNSPEKEVEEPHLLGEKIKAYIDEHYMEPITLQSIGKVMYLNPYYIGHIFKQMSGYSPMQYLLRRRIGEAQTLLIETDLPLSEIAGRVGFETQSYFNTQFTKNIGMPPKKFRQSYIVRS